MDPKLPPFISEYTVLYSELHPNDTAKHVSPQDINTRIGLINKSLTTKQATSYVAPIDSEVVKILSPDQVKDINKLARKTLWTESSFATKCKIVLFKIFTLGFYSGVEQIPVKEFTASVSSYIEKTKFNSLINTLQSSLPTFIEGQIENDKELGQTKSFTLWNNADAQNALMVSVADQGNWTHYRCNFDKMNKGVFTLINLNPQKSHEEIELPIKIKKLTTLNPFEASQKFGKRLANSLQANLNAPSYGTVHFQEVMLPHFVSLPVDGFSTVRALLRSCEGTIKTDVVAITRRDNEYLLSTWSPDGRIKDEKITVDMDGQVVLTDIATSQHRDFKTVESFRDKCFNNNSVSIRDARRHINLGPANRKAIEEQTAIIRSGAKEMGLLKSPPHIDAEKLALWGRLNILDPADAGGFIYEVEPQRFKVVYGSTEGFVEKDLVVGDDGRVMCQGERFAPNTTLNLILKWDQKPFVTVAEGLRNLAKMQKPGAPLLELCRMLRKNVAFCPTDSVDEILNQFKARIPEKQRAGIWMFSPVELPKPSGFFTWVRNSVWPGEDEFKEVIVRAHDGNDFRSLRVRISTETAAKPFEYLGKFYATVAEIVADQILQDKAKDIKTRPFRQALASIGVPSNARPSQISAAKPTQTVANVPAERPQPSQVVTVARPPKKPMQSAPAVAPVQQRPMPPPGQSAPSGFWATLWGGVGPVAGANQPAQQPVARPPVAQARAPQLMANPAPAAQMPPPQAPQVLIPVDVAADLDYERKSNLPMQLTVRLCAACQFMENKALTKPMATELLNRVLGGITYQDAENYLTRPNKELGINNLPINVLSTLKQKSFRGGAVKIQTFLKALHDTANA